MIITRCDYYSMLLLYCTQTTRSTTITIIFTIVRDFGYPSWPNSSVHSTNRVNSPAPTELCALRNAFMKSA